jgi:hypothetical protein
MMVIFSEGILMFYITTRPAATPSETEGELGSLRHGRAEDRNYMTTKVSPAVGLPQCDSPTNPLIVSSPHRLHRLIATKKGAPTDTPKVSNMSLS